MLCFSPLCVCTTNTSPRKVRSRYNNYHSVLVCFKLECSVEGFPTSAQSTYIIQKWYFFFFSFHPTSQSLALLATCSPDCSEHHGAGSLSQLTEVPLSPGLVFSSIWAWGPSHIFSKDEFQQEASDPPRILPSGQTAQILPLMCLCQPPPPHPAQQEVQRKIV